MRFHRHVDGLEQVVVHNDESVMEIFFSFIKSLSPSSLVRTKGILGCSAEGLFSLSSIADK